MTPRFTRNQINAFQWEKQGFGGRFNAPSPLYSSLIGLYGTPPTCYLTLWARVADFQLNDLDQALNIRRSVARLRAMRNTLYLLPEKWIPIAFQATLDHNLAPFQRMVLASGLSEDEYARTSERILETLQAGPLTTSQIKDRLQPQRKAVNSAFSFIIGTLCAEGRLVRAIVSGGWRSNLYSYDIFERWLPGLDLHAITPEEARIKLGRLYFEAYGPATAEDFRWWSGLHKKESETTMAKLGPELVRVTIDGFPAKAIVSQEDAESISSFPDQAPQGLVLLPVWDAYVMAYRYRDRYLASDRHAWIYDSGGNATSTILIDGEVAGIWDFEEHKNQLLIRFALFNDQAPAKAVRQRLEAWGQSLATLIGTDELQVRNCPLPGPLGRTTQARFRAPLKDC